VESSLKILAKAQKIKVIAFEASAKAGEAKSGFQQEQCEDEIFLQV
jgi:hypothetical protein